MLNVLKFPNVVDLPLAAWSFGAVMNAWVASAAISVAATYCNGFLNAAQRGVHMVTAGCYERSGKENSILSTDAPEITNSSTPSPKRSC
jgi:hypothetical protein